MHYIFVFGTLKAGFPNFEYNSGQRIDGDFQTAEKYLLYLVGERYSPWLIDNHSLTKEAPDLAAAQQVIGQVFQVDDQGLQMMDTLERITEDDGYQRVTTQVISLNDHQAHQAFIYIKQREQLNLNEIKQGPFKEYLLEHAQLYRSRSAHENRR